MLSEWSTVNSVETCTKYQVQCTMYPACGRQVSEQNSCPTTNSYLVLGTLYLVPSTLEIGFDRKPKLLHK